MLTFDFYNFINNSILGGFIILIILLLKKSLFKRFSNKFNYFVWIPLLICIILPIKIRISETSIEKSPNYLKSFYFNLPTNSFNEKYNFFFNDALLYTYLGISIFYFLYYILKLIRDRKELALYSFEVKNNHINKIYNKVADELNIKKRLSLRVSDCISTPINVGIIYSNIVIPNINYSDEELELIFKHEFIHGKRHDFFIKTFTQLVVSFNWFNPLFYIMKKDVLAFCELSCDETVMKLSSKKDIKTYGYMLIKTSGDMYERDDSLFSTLSSSSSVKNRIYSLMDNNKKIDGSIFLTILSILFIVIFLNINIKIYSVPNIINSSYFNICENSLYANSKADNTYADYLFFTISNFLQNDDIDGLKIFLQKNNINYNIKNSTLTVDTKDISINLNLTSPNEYILFQK
ncbi:MAG: M56 family metallopeptidase [Clostridium sp.]|nr:M56 family metallopeptidase [Clostridium sp.]